MSQVRKASNALKDDVKAAEESDAIVRKEAAAELEEAKLESEPARHTEPKMDSDLDKGTTVEASAEKPDDAGGEQNDQQVDQVGEQSFAELTHGSGQNATKVEKKQSDKEETNLESDKVVEADGFIPDHGAEQDDEVGESGAEEIEPEAKTEHETTAVPEIATATKTSKATLYLSCSNVISLKTFCEVKLQVCVSANYMK